MNSGNIVLRHGPLPTSIDPGSALRLKGTAIGCALEKKSEIKSVLKDKQRTEIKDEIHQFHYGMCHAFYSCAVEPILMPS